MKNSPDALVTVSLLPTERGGRQGPTPAAAFGCIMTIGGQNLDVGFRLEHVGPLRPGMIADLEVNFLDSEHAKNSITVGQEFSLREAKIIGHGTIKEIFIA